MEPNHPLSGLFGPDDIIFHPALIQHHRVRRQYQFQSRPPSQSQQQQQQQHLRRRRSGTSLQNANVSEKDGSVKLSIDLPGVRSKDVMVELDQGVLKVSGQRRGVAGRPGTVFERKFRLEQSTLDVTKTKANLSDGVLVVTVAKRSKPALVRVSVTEHKHPEELLLEEEEEKEEKDNADTVEEGQSTAKRARLSEESEETPPPPQSGEQQKDGQVSRKPMDLPKVGTETASSSES